MGRFESANITWPPKGWPQFAAIKASSGQALAKNIGTARIFGLQYTIESMPLVQGNVKVFRHDITITGWEYSILGESNEYPVLSFSVTDRFDPALAKEYFISDIRSYDTAIPHNARTAARAVSAALFLIRQIGLGNVPDVNRILQVYRLHPVQSMRQKGGGDNAKTFISKTAGDVLPAKTTAKL